MTNKILQINVVANSGSTGKITEKIGDMVISQGWESYIVYGRWGRKSSSQLYYIGDKIESLAHGLISLFFDFHGRGSILSTHKLISYINTLQPDIIHLHNIHGYYLNYKLLFKYLETLNIPVIWTLHDCWSYTGHCAYYTASKCFKWQYDCNNCPNRWDYPKTLIDNSHNNYIRKKDSFTKIKNLTIVTVSEWLKNEVKRSFLSKYPIEKISNGIDLNIFKPLTSDIKKKYNIENKFVILGVATQWVKRKGLDDFIKLSKIISNDICIVLVGVTNKQKHRLPHNIIGISKTEDIEEMVKLYTTANVYISFSEEETFGMTIIESMACGTPAIVYDSTACKELINDKVGYVVNVHDIESAYKHVIDIKSSGKEVFSNYCIEHVRKYYSDKITFSKYIDLYKKLINDNNNNRNL